MVIMDMTFHDTRQSVKRLNVTAMTLDDGNQGKDSLATQVLRGGVHGTPDLPPSEHSLPSPFENWQNIIS